MKKVFAILLILSTVLSVLSSCEVSGPDSDTESLQSESESGETYPHENMVTALPGDIIAKTDTLEIPALYLRYFFVDSLKSFCNQYYQTLSSYFDVYAPLHDQIPTVDGYTEYSNWYEYFLKIAKSALEYHVALYEQAQANGFELTQEQLEYIDEQLDVYEADAAEYEMTFEEFMDESQNLGEGVTREMMKDFLVLCNTASYFAETKYADYGFDDSQIEEYFNSNKFDYLVVDYRACNIYPDSDLSDSDEEIKKSKEEALAKGNKFVAELNAGKSFLDAYKTVYPDKSDTTYKTFEVESLIEKESRSFYQNGEEIVTPSSEWLFEDGRKDGDATVLQDSSGRVTVLQAVKAPYRDETLLPDIRVIYLSLQNGEYTEKTGEEKAKELVEQINNSDDKQNLVISLVKEYSKDTNTAQNDGLLSAITPDYAYIPSNIVRWCFNSGRNVGDVMYSEYEYNSVVTGYFVIYFDAFGLPLWKNSVVKDMKNTQMSELVEQWLDSLSLTYDDAKTDTVYK